MEASARSFVDAGEVLVPFSQVHLVVSATIRSRLWQLQEGGSSDDEDIILAETAVESKAVNQPVEPSDDISKSSQGNGAQSSIPSNFRRSLRVGGRGHWLRVFFEDFKRSIV